MGVRGLNFDLVDQLTFYGSYHHNKWNQLIHLVFVPLILASAEVWLAATGPLFSIDLTQYFEFLGRPLASCFVLNGASLLTLLYFTYYVILEAVAGFTWGLVIGWPLFVGATAFYQHVPHAWFWAILLHLLSWWMQIVPGHTWCEHRKPALMDSFFQSLFLAPLFVWFEVLFHLGYRPALYKEVEDRIEKKLKVQQSQEEGLLNADKVVDT